MTMGPIDDALKRIVIESKPGSRVIAGTFLPIANEKNITKGNIIPNIMGGGLR
jgi:hypothetical protein